MRKGKSQSVRLLRISPRVCKGFRGLRERGASSVVNRQADLHVFAMTHPSRQNVGLFGLGIIGSVWARHFENAGRLAAAWNRSPKPDFPRWVETPGEVVGRAKILFIVVADPPAVKGLLDQVVPKLTAEHVVIQSSTIDPDSSEGFHRQVTATGARYLEAPFTGSRPAAEERRTVFYLGGEPSLAAEVEPVLELISETRFHIGAPRQAAALKLAMNLQIAVMTEALCESLTLARRSGIGDDTFFEVMRKNVAWSGLAALKEPKLRADDFAPQFSVKHMHKDMRLALATGDESLPLTRAVRDCLHRAEAGGAGDEDFIALIKNLTRREDAR